MIKPTNVYAIGTLDQVRTNSFTPESIITPHLEEAHVLLPTFQPDLDKEHLPTPQFIGSYRIFEHLSSYNSQDLKNDMSFLLTKLVEQHTKDPEALDPALSQIGYDPNSVSEQFVKELIGEGYERLKIVPYTELEQHPELLTKTHLQSTNLTNLITDEITPKPNVDMVDHIVTSGRELLSNLTLLRIKEGLTQSENEQMNKLLRCLMDQS